MEVKLFEIRDHATFIPAIAIAIDGMTNASEAENWLARRAGYGGRCILLTRLGGGGPAEYDPYNWPNRTMRGAHFLIERDWDILTSGDVVDARVGLGEAEHPVESERIKEEA
jgi:hypothetical protein